MSLFDRLFRINAHNKLHLGKVQAPNDSTNNKSSPSDTVPEPSPQRPQYRPMLSPVIDQNSAGQRSELTERIRKLITEHNQGQQARTSLPSTDRKGNLVPPGRDKVADRTNSGRRRATTADVRNRTDLIVGVRRDGDALGSNTTSSQTTSQMTASQLWMPRTQSEAPPKAPNVHTMMSETDALKLTKPNPPNRVERLMQRGGNHPNASETYAMKASAAQSKPLPRNHFAATDNSEYSNALTDENSHANSTLQRSSIPSIAEGITEDALMTEELVAKRRYNVEAVFGSDERHMRAVVKHSIRMQMSVDKTLSPDVKHMIYPFPEEKIPAETNIRDLYSLRHVLGEGAFAKVHLAVHRLTAVKVAIKVFEKTKISSETARKRIDIEIRNHSKMVHPNIARMYEVMESPRRIYMIMEFGPHGDLHKYVSKRRRLDNAAARQIFAEVVKGVYYMHEALCIAHRDIKLENCLLSNDKVVQLVDLGFSTDASKPLKVACGSPSYTAPEIIARQPYDGKKVDMWSMGVLLYAMLCGYFPFQGHNNVELGMKIRKGVFRIPDHVNSDAADLVRHLLVVNEKQRYTVENVASHAWLRGVLDDSVMRARADKCKEQNHLHETNDSVLDIMQAVGFNKESVSSAVERNAHNHVTATYHLLETKRNHILKPNLANALSFSTENTKNGQRGRR